jgi:hypothetical protein
MHKLPEFNSIFSVFVVGKPSTVFVTTCCSVIQYVGKIIQQGALYSVLFLVVTKCFGLKWPSLETAAELLGSWKLLAVSAFMLLLFWITSCNLKIFAKCVNLLGASGSRSETPGKF